MANYAKKINETTIRTGECRFSYVNVFAPRKNEDGTDGKYSVQLLIPKSDAATKKLIDESIKAACEKGVSSKWNGKMPPASKLHMPLRDGDEEFPEDETYAGHWFMNASSSATQKKPGAMVLENGQLVEALDSDDLYSGCYGLATIAFFPYSTSGNVGIAVGLNNLVKLRDGESLGGGRSAAQDFADLASEGADWL